MQRLLLSLLLTLFSLLSYSQNSELGVFLGGSYYIGDLNPGKHFNSLTKPAWGVIYRHNFNSRVALRGNIFLGTIEGNDSKANSLFQQQRNLSFKSKVSEFSAQLEINFVEFKLEKSKYLSTLYVFLGAGLFKFNPKAEIAGSWIRLQPLGTEGQQTLTNPDLKKYKLLQISVPFGVGAKFSLAKKIGLSLEWGMRKTFTDYLDDVSKTYTDPVLLDSQRGSIAASLSDRSFNNSGFSNAGRQRGDSKTKDWYCFSGIVLSFQIFEKQPKCYGYP